MTTRYPAGPRRPAWLRAARAFLAARKAAEAAKQQQPKPAESTAREQGRQP